MILFGTLTVLVDLALVQGNVVNPLVVVIVCWVVFGVVLYFLKVVDRTVIIVRRLVLFGFRVVGFLVVLVVIRRLVVRLVGLIVHGLIVVDFTDRGLIVVDLTVRSLIVVDDFTAHGFIVVDFTVRGLYVVFTLRGLIVVGLTVHGRMVVDFLVHGRNVVHFTVRGILVVDFTVRGFIVDGFTVHGLIVVDLKRLRSVLRTFTRFLVVRVTVCCIFLVRIVFRRIADLVVARVEVTVHGRLLVDFMGRCGNLVGFVIGTQVFGVKLAVVVALGLRVVLLDLVV